MDCNWSIYILMIFGATLKRYPHSKHQCNTSVRLFKKKKQQQNKTIPTDHLIIFVDFGNYESLFLRFGGSHMNRRLMSEI